MKAPKQPTTFDERLTKITNEAFQNSDSTNAIIGYVVQALCENARQLDRIAVQLEKITSLKYTEDA